MSGATLFRKGKRWYLYARNATVNNGRMACCYCGAPLLGGVSLNEHPRKRDWMQRAGLEPATLDHVLPRSCGGSNDPENVVVACQACNLEKGGCEPWEVWPEMAAEVEALIEREVSATPDPGILERFRRRAKLPDGAGWGVGAEP